MKNLKKVIFALMVVFLVVGFIGCKTETDPVPPEQETPVTPDPVKPGQETPAVTNKFKGNVFVAEYSLGYYSGIRGYIEFIDNTNGKMGEADYDEFGNPIIIEQPFTYSVTDDVATLKATMDDKEVTVTTSKLTGGIFTFSTEYVGEKPEETISILMTCTKGDKSLFDVWTARYLESDVKKAFYFEFEDYFEILVVGDDYELDEANKKIVLTENGYKKCCQSWVINFGEESSADEEFIDNMLTFNMIGLEEKTDYTIDIENLTITVKGSGMEKIKDATWTISNPDKSIEITRLEFELPYMYECYKLVEGTDYTKNDATKTVTLTASGWAKVEAAEGDKEESTSY